MGRPGLGRVGVGVGTSNLRKTACIGGRAARMASWAFSSTLEGSSSLGLAGVPWPSLEDCNSPEMLSQLLARSSVASGGGRGRRHRLCIDFHRASEPQLPPLVSYWTIVSELKC